MCATYSHKIQKRFFTFAPQIKRNTPLHIPSKEKLQPALTIKMTNNSIPYEDGAISHFFISLESNMFKNICLTFEIT